jgi:HAD superfamily hydrolase (TIGR01484 family)
MQVRYQVLATDFDGTIARDGSVADAVVDGLQRLKATGRRLVLVTGRELPDLQNACPALGIFDRVVAENGGVLFAPETRNERVLGGAPHDELVRMLQDEGVRPLSTGRVVIATGENQQWRVLRSIQRLGLAVQIVPNRDSLMVLPASVDKASGLHEALAELLVPPQKVVGVGDAENDLVFLRMCGCSVAVADALPLVKARVDLLTSQPNGEGVLELIDNLIASDLAAPDARLKQRNGFRPQTLVQ